MRSGVAVFVGMIVFVLGPATVRAEPELRGREYIRDFMQRFAPEPDTNYVPAAIEEVRTAASAKDWQSVERLASAIIDKDVGAFESGVDANWTKALALFERANARYQQTGDASAGVGDMIAAANRGYAEAVTRLSDLIIRLRLRGQVMPGMPTDPEPFLRIGAELGSATAAMTLGGNEWDNRLPRAEQVYWLLVGRAYDMQRFTHADRQLLLRDAASQIPEAALASIIARMSPLGGMRRPGPKWVPGRAVYATVWVDAMLRHEYGAHYGSHPAAQSKPVTPSTLDVFHSTRAVTDAFGIATAFMLVPGDRAFDDPTIVSVPATELGRELGPGDRVVVRCGPLSHVATVHSVNQAKDSVTFVDGLYQYWQTSHNSCVSRFELVPHKHGGHLARLALSDVIPTIQGVITIRDRALPTRRGASTAQRRNIAEVGPALGRGGMHEVLEEIQKDATTLYFAANGSPRTIGLQLQLDAEHRVHEARLLIDRGWRDKHRPEVQQWVAKVLAAVLPPAAHASLGAPKPASGPSKRSQRAVAPCDRALREVIDGTRTACASDVEGGRISADNLADEYKAPRLRVTFTAR